MVGDDGSGGGGDGSRGGTACLEGGGARVEIQLGLFEKQRGDLRCGALPAPPQRLLSLEPMVTLGPMMLMMRFPMESTPEPSDGSSCLR